MKSAGWRIVMRRKRVPLVKPARLWWFVTAVLAGHVAGAKPTLAQP